MAAVAVTCGAQVAGAAARFSSHPSRRPGFRNSSKQDLCRNSRNATRAVKHRDSTQPRSSLSEARDSEREQGSLKKRTNAGVAKGGKDEQLISIALAFESTQESASDLLLPNAVVPDGPVTRRSALTVGLACAASLALPGWTIVSPAVAQESDQLTTSSTSTSTGSSSNSGSTTTTAAGEDGIFRRYYKPDGTERATNPYSFLIPRGWLPVPVSLNDSKLYGLDSRFVSPTPAAALGGGGGGAAGAAGGYASVVDVFVLPVGNADKASIEEVGDLEDVIGIFGPPDQPTRVIDASIQERPAGTTYYHYELVSPPALLSAYVSDSQIYIFQVSAPGLSKRQWRESFYLFEAMRDSFTNEARL